MPHATHGKVKPTKPGGTVEPPDPPAINAPTALVAAAGVGQITLTHDAVENATRYGTYRNTANNPSAATLINDARTALSYTDPTVSGTSPYYYWVDAVLVEGSSTYRSDKSLVASAALPLQGDADAIVPGSIVAWPTRKSLGFQLPFSGDDAGAGSAIMRYRESSNGGSSWGSWKGAIPPIRSQRRHTDIVYASSNTSSINLSKEVGNNDIYTGWRVEVLTGAQAGYTGTITGFAFTSGNTDPTKRIITVSPALGGTLSAGVQVSLQDPLKLFGKNLLWLNAGDLVELEVTLDHPDGVNGTNPVTAQVQMLEDDLVAASSLTTTHYVTPNGSLTASGSGTLGSPWNLLATAVSYWNSNGGNMVVELAGGRHQVRNLTLNARSGTFTIKAANPALTDVSGPWSGANPPVARANVGNRAIIEYGITTGPSGGDAPLSNVWSSAGLGTGPVTGVTLTNWYTYTAPMATPTTEPEYLGFADTYDDEPWTMLHSGLESTYTTNAAIAEFIQLNDMDNFGWFVSLSNPNQVYARLPSIASSPNPNNLYMTIGAGVGITAKCNGTPVNGSAFRVTGCEFRGYQTGLSLTVPAAYHAVDHNLFCGMRYHVALTASKTAKVYAYGIGHLIERNEFREWTYRAQPGEDPSGYIARMYIKNNPSFYSGGGTSGTKYVSNKPGGDNEGVAIRGLGGAWQTTCRHNLIDGCFNGQSNYNVGYDRFAGISTEVYENVILNVADDCLTEAEPNCALYRAFSNRTEYCSVFGSMSPAQWGPITLVDNVCWQHGKEEVPPPQNPHALTLEEKVAPLFCKVSTKNFPYQTVEAVNNTWWSNQPESHCIHQANSGNPGDKPGFYLRNNIFRTGGQVVRSGEVLNTWDENYNLMAGEDGTRVLEQEKTTIAAYRSASGDGANSNYTATILEFDVIAVAAIDALLVDPENGDLNLIGTGGTHGLGEGVEVGNLSTGLQSSPPRIGAVNNLDGF